MTLIRLSLTDFRNHAGADMAAGPGLVALHGDNGAGKTNILEAISLLAPGRGVLWAGVRRRGERRSARTSGVLVDLETAMHAGPPPTLAQLALRLRPGSICHMMYAA